MAQQQQILTGVHLHPGELKGIDTTRILSDSITDFDVYLSVGGFMVLYAPSPYRWSGEELNRLVADGHAQIFFMTRDEGKVRAYEKICSLPSIDESLPPSKRISHITDVASELSRVLFDEGLSESVLDKGRDVVDAMIRCVSEDVACVQALGLLAQHNQYTYFHSGRVAAYSLSVAITMGMRDQMALQNLGLGCLLHDIGKSKIDTAVIEKASPLTEREWREIRRHPELGHKMLEDSKLSIVPLEVILHHHERLDGKGYPHGLKKGEIMDEVAIAAFADVFDALTSNRPWAKSRSRFEALDFVRFHMLDQLSVDVYKAMVDVLCKEQKKAS